MNGNIMKKLAAVQKDLKAPKGQYNEFGKYKYRNCEDILEAVKPLLAKNDLTLTISDTITEVGGRIYVKATATIYNAEDEISVSAFAREEESKKGMDASQVTGAASSYARKYALNGLFCIDDTKDADATNTHGKEAPKPEPKAEVPLKCEACGNVIEPFVTGKGVKWEPERMAEFTKKKYGKVLCAACATAANES